MPCLLWSSAHCLGTNCNSAISVGCARRRAAPCKCYGSPAVFRCSRPRLEEHSTSDQCLLAKCGKMAPRSWNSGHSQCLGCFRTVLQMLFFLFKSSAWYSRRPTSLRRIVCGAVQLARACLSDTEGSLVVWRAPALKSIVAFNKRSQGRASFL